MMQPLVARVEHGELIWEVFRGLSGWLLAYRPGGPNKPSVVRRYATEAAARTAMDADIRAHGYEPEPPASTQG